MWTYKESFPLQISQSDRLALDRVHHSHAVRGVVISSASHRTISRFVGRATRLNKKQRGNDVPASSLMIWDNASSRGEGVRKMYPEE